VFGPAGTRSVEGRLWSKRPIPEYEGARELDTLGKPVVGILW